MIRYSIILFLLFSLLSGCGSQYGAERLFWQAKEEAKKVTLDKTLDELNAEDYERIIAAYQRVIDRYPLELLAAQSHFIIAQLYSLQKEFANAQKELVKVTQNFSKNSAIASRALFMIGNLYEQQGEWEAAVSEYEKVVDLYPISGFGLKIPIYIAQHYQREQLDAEAEKAYQQAIRNYEEIIQTYSGTSLAPIVMDHLALIYLNQGDWDKAIEIWQEVTNEYSQSPIAEKSLLASGEIYARQARDIQKAIQKYEEFVKQYPKSKVIKQAKFKIGNLYFNKGDTKKAKEIFRQIISEYPQEANLCANVRYSLAVCYEKEADNKSAIDEYKRIRADYPETNIALAVPFFIARHYLKVESDEAMAELAFGEAISEYKKIIEEQKSDLLILQASKLISLCYIQQEKWYEVIDSLNNLVERFPEQPVAPIYLFNIAEIYKSRLNKPEKAAQVYEELIKKYPSPSLVSFAKMKLEALKDIQDSE